MSELLQYRDEFLKAILECEAPPLSRACIRCSQPMSWRCHDCFGEPVLCSSCVVTTHSSSPFHRVSRWDGRTFYRSCLSDAGFVLHVGHEGRPCATSTIPPLATTTINHSSDLNSRLPNVRGENPNEPSCTSNSSPDMLFSANVSPLTVWEKAGVNLDTVKTPQHLDTDGNPWLTIVDITGIHQIQAHYCHCTDSSHLPDYLRLLRNGLYPASIVQPRTVFTFRALEDYDLLNLETKATPQRYLAKLQRLTTNLFPDTLPDRYRELLRVIRQWRNLKQRKAAGQAFTPSAEISSGGLAQFCPTCPQPGVNLPENWQEDPHRLVSSSCFASSQN